MSKVKVKYTTEVEVEIDLKKVEDYLILKGWVDDGPYGEFGRLFVNKISDGGYIVTTVLMTTDKIGDWNARMNELIKEVADAEKRSVPELLEDLK